jgi:valyl-tRNA synthetase
VLERERAAVVLLTGTDPSVEPGEPDRSGKAKIVVSVADLYVPLEGLLDLEAERARLSKQEAKLALEAERVEAKLANADFLAKAPADVVDKQQVRLAELRESATRVRSQLDELG